MNLCAFKSVWQLETCKITGDEEISLLPFPTIAIPEFISMEVFFLFPFAHVFLFKDLIITRLEAMAFQKHLSQQFSTGDVGKNISPVFSSEVFSLMCNYELCLHSIRPGSICFTGKFVS